MDIVSYTLGKKAGGGGTPPVYQDKEVSITQNGTSTITKDSGYDALNSVELTVAVPQPSGKISITQNGTDIDVSSYATADVNVPAGADLSEYFNDTISNSSNYKKLFKKIPTLTASGDSLNGAFSGYDLSSPIPDIDATNVSNFSSMFKSSKYEGKLDCSTWDFNMNVITNLLEMFQYSYFTEIDLSSLGYATKSITMQRMFSSCSKLKKVNLSNFDNVHDSVSGLFQGCTSMEEIDISNWSFTFNASFNTNIFGSSASDGVPDNCLILVKDQTSKNWINTNYSRLTNVQIKSEYIANQGA